MTDERLTGPRCPSHYRTPPECDPAEGAARCTLWEGHQTLPEFEYHRNDLTLTREWHDLDTDGPFRIVPKMGDPSTLGEFGGVLEWRKALEIAGSLVTRLAERLRGPGPAWYGSVQIVDGNDWAQAEGDTAPPVPRVFAQFTLTYARDPAQVQPEPGPDAVAVTYRDPETQTPRDSVVFAPGFDALNYGTLRHVVGHGITDPEMAKRHALHILEVLRGQRSVHVTGGDAQRDVDRVAGAVTVRSEPGDLCGVFLGDEPLGEGQHREDAENWARALRTALRVALKSRAAPEHVFVKDPLVPCPGKCGRFVSREDRQRRCAECKAAGA